MSIFLSSFRVFSRALAVAALLAVLSAKSWAVPAQVLIIRHAEKPADSSDPNLSQQGYAHAQELVQYFSSNPAVTRFGTPIAIYAMANNSPDSGLRPIETVTPLSQALGVPIQAQYSKSDASGLANDILTNPAYDGRMVLICWEHKHIPEIAQALGASDAPQSWSGSEFDLVWEIDYFTNAAPQFTQYYQQLSAY